MELNRKNAMKKWEESFGRDVMTVDFAGRKIQKGAYQQLTSAYGWVLAPVLPKSEGGALEPSNLICLHVRTAEEKSDDFPTFKAGDIRYNIVAQGGKWIIEQSEDNEAIAEQEAMIAAAMEKWVQFFGDEEKTVDFCGREIIKEHYMSDCAGAWKVAPYVTSKPVENKNSYIAHVASIEEAYGKTAFRANGKQFTLNKDNGAYYFKESVAKPQRRSFDLGNPLSVAERIDRSIEEFGALSESGVWLDFIMVGAVIDSSVPEYASAALTDTVSFILREQVGSWLSSEVSGFTDEDGCYHSFMSFRFTSPQISDMERLFNASMLLNTYASMLTAKFGLRMFKVYNYANNFAGTQIHYPNSVLSAYNPEFKELLGAFFGCENGMYEGESATTLYVSRFIIYNIKALSEAHGEETQYFTSAQLAEHNYIYSGLKDAIDSYLVPSPEPSMPDEEPQLPEISQASPGKESFEEQESESPDAVTAEKIAPEEEKDEEYVEDCSGIPSDIDAEYYSTEEESEETEPVYSEPSEQPETTEEIEDTEVYFDIDSEE